jgi:ATP-dependent DNA ligase
MITKKDIMLCESITEPELQSLNGEYLANIKFDGERILAIKNKDDVFILNRAGRIKNKIYPEIAEQIKELDGDFILDGEIITSDGLFNSLQHRSNLSDLSKIEKARTDYPIKFMVFDILFLNGIDLRHKPLKERINLLQNNFSARLCLVRYQPIDEALSFAKLHKLEGIVIKDMLSVYEGRRSRSWLKLKLFKQADMRAVRYTINNAGLRLEDEGLNAVQCSGNQSDEVKRAIDEKGWCDIVIQYLEKTKDNRYRFISFVGVKQNDNKS